MGKVGRSIGAVIAGFVAASVVMFVVESINGHVLYPEMGKLAEGVTDREAMRALMASAPAGAFCVVLFGWTLGSFVGGYVATRIGGNASKTLALIVGGLLLLAGIANNLMLPPPLWFWIASVLVLLPAACVGGLVASRKQQAAAMPSAAG